jgi:hypothetical protein
MRIRGISKNVKFAVAIVVVALLAFSLGNIELAKDVNSAGQPSSQESSSPNPNASAKPSKKATPTPSMTPTAIPSKAPTKKSSTKTIPTDSNEGTNAGGAEKVGIKTTDVETLEGMITDIDSYIAAVKGGNETLATQLCSSLNADYNQALKLIKTTSSIVKVEQLLTNSKEVMYAAVSDCATGLSKGNDTLINQSLTEFASASKFLKALVKLNG